MQEQRRRSSKHSDACAIQDPTTTNNNSNSNSFKEHGHLERSNSLLQPLPSAREPQHQLAMEASDAAQPKEQNIDAADANDKEVEQAHNNDGDDGKSGSPALAQHEGLKGKAVGVMVGRSSSQVWGLLLW